MPEDNRLSASEIDKTDARRLYEVYESWPTSAREVARLRVDVKRKKYNRVIYLAVGGSATAGEVISDWFLSSGGTEVSVFNGFLPKVNFDDTLVVVCSTSGNTEETLRLATQVSRHRPSMVTISSGGRLMEFAEKEGITHVKIPMSMAPRYSLPYSLFAAVAVLHSASLTTGLEWEIDEALENLEKVRKRIRTAAPLSKNASKQTATAISGSIPRIYGSSVTKSVVKRFKTSLNENAKIAAFSDYAPDLFHNEVEAWEMKNSVFKPVILRRAGDPRYEVKALDKFVTILEAMGNHCHQVTGSGRGNLSQLVTLGYTLDFAAYYTAILRGVNPFEVRIIDELKGAR
jgi:glucose/mannose-6-phosphate isomerase